MDQEAPGGQAVSGRLTVEFDYEDCPYVMVGRAKLTFPFPVDLWEGDVVWYEHPNVIAVQRELAWPSKGKLVAKYECTRS